MEAPMDDKQKKQKMKKPRIEFDQSTCWFCLSSPSVEKHLIIAVGTSSYIALAKGLYSNLICNFSLIQGCEIILMIYSLSYRDFFVMLPGYCWCDYEK